MSEYLLRKGSLFYEIAKFEDSAEPIAVYKFTTRGCSCPNRNRSCKHSTILDLWKKAGEVPGIVYNDNGHTLSVLPVQ